MARRLGSVAGFGTALAVGVVALAVIGAGRESRQVQTLGVTPVYPVAPIEPGQEACQDDIGLAAPLERIRFNVGTHGKPGVPLEVTVRSPAGAPIGTTAHVGAGWVDDGTPKEVSVGRITADQKVSVCVRNRGRIRAYVWGDIHTGSIRKSILGVRPTVTPSSGSIDGKPIPGDLALWFMSEQPRPLLARLPDMFERASRFRPGLVGPWTYWLLLAAAVTLVPIALFRALRSTQGLVEETDAVMPRPAAETQADLDGGAPEELKRTRSREESWEARS
jgi:hypothetical protein